MTEAKKWKEKEHIIRANLALYRNENYESINIEECSHAIHVGRKTIERAFSGKLGKGYEVAIENLIDIAEHYDLTFETLSEKHFWNLLKFRFRENDKMLNMFAALMVMCIFSVLTVLCNSILCSSVVLLAASQALREATNMYGVKVDASKTTVIRNVAIVIVLANITFESIGLGW